MFLRQELTCYMDKTLRDVPLLENNQVWGDDNNHLVSLSDTFSSNIMARSVLFRGDLTEMSS